MSADFTLFAVDTPGVLPSEHTFILTSDGSNFNCFGQPRNDGRFVRKASGSSKWAKLIYGPDEGIVDVKPAAGLRVRYDGVCQTAANRILVLTGDGVDARGTKGNVLATLMYGKFGFDVDAYIDSVRTSGAQLAQAGEIAPGDTQAVLDRIALGQLPGAELDLLHADIQEQWNVVLPDISRAQRDIFDPIYCDYQKERTAAFLATAGSVPYEVGVGLNGIAPQLLQSLRKPLGECVARLAEALGSAQFSNMFYFSRDDLKDKLSKLGLVQ